MTRPCRLLGALVWSALLLVPMLVTFDGLWSLIGGALTNHELASFGEHQPFGLRAYAVALWATTSGALALALVEVALALGGRALARLVPGWTAERRLALAVTLGATPLAIYLAGYLLSGGLMRRVLPGVLPRLGLAILLVTLAFVGTWIWAARLEPLLRRRRFTGRTILVGTVLGLVTLDCLVLPGLYLPLHALLVLMAALAWQRLLWDAALEELPLRRWARAAIAAVVAIVLLSVPLLLPWEARPFENFLVARFTVFSGKGLQAAGEMRRWIRGTVAGRSWAEHTEQVGSADLRRFLDARDRQWPDVYLILVDGLTSFRTSIEGGAARDTTPFLAELAARGVYFPRAYSTSPITIASLRSLLSGSYQHERKPAPAPFRPLLLERFRGLGYRIYCDVPFAKEILGQTKVCDLAVTVERADWACDSLLSFLSASGPVFAVALLSATHPPYQTFGRRLGARPEDAYDAALMGTDRLLRQLHDGAARLGRDVRYIIAGDHGQAFGWHGLSGHSSSLYEDQIRVPLILAGFRASPQRVARPVSLLDVTATLVGGMGADLQPLLRAERAAARAVPIGAFFREQTAVIDGNLKLLIDVTSGSEELYDVYRDPRERTNLVPLHGSALQQLGAHARRLQSVAQHE